MLTYSIGSTGTNDKHINMKFIKNIALAMIVLAMFGCNDLDEVLPNPNGVDPSLADPVSLYNSVQLGFNGVAASGAVDAFAGGLARMRAEIGGFAYQATHSPQEFSGYWSQVYAGLFPDIDAYIALAEPIGLTTEVASAKIMKAYVYMQLVDLFNDVPTTQAGQGNAEDQNLTPTADAGEDVYNQAIALLDEAIGLLTAEGAPSSFASSAFDNYFGGSAAGWLKFANSLKLRAAVTTRLVNGAGGAGTISSIVDGGDFIAANGDNAEFKYGTSRANPNNRHPYYNDSYEENDGNYQSNWYMWLMAESRDTVVDPRLRYYFYRQSTRVFPNEVEDTPNAFDCIFTAVPDPEFIPEHYEDISEDMPYCLGSYTKSYFGRDHLNGSGLPPDGAIRTIYGLYPGGGEFDTGVGNGDRQNLGVDGALGAGISPVWQASWTHFILAEAVLTMGVSGDAKQLLEDGVRLSIARVTAFESKVDGAEVIATTPSILTVGDTYASGEDIERYVSAVMNEYDEATNDTDRLALIAREYIVALFGAPLEAYNLYRRTCLPANIQPSIDPNSGPFIRSALYPQNHVDLNQNISQKSGGFEEPVFWDTNDASCNY